MNKRMLHVIALTVTGACFTSGAFAGTYTCSQGARLYKDDRGQMRCSDGGIPLFHADEVKPLHADGVGSNKKSSEPPTGRSNPAQAPAAIFNRDWHLYVPGGAYQTENVVEGTRTLHTSSGTGTLPHVLHIAPDGAYKWTAYGDVIKGRWVPGDRSYPVVLQNAYEHKDWKVSLGNGQLQLWDGRSLAGQFKGK